MFECLVGYPPFCSETPHETYKKIMNWREFLFIPEECNLSREAEDLIRRFLCDAPHRLGDPQLIKRHPFFRGIDWVNLRNTRAPFIPQLKSITDTSYFPVDELSNVPDQVNANAGGQGMGTVGTVGMSQAQKDLAFVGYTFKRFDDLTRRGGI